MSVRVGVDFINIRLLTVIRFNNFEITPELSFWGRNIIISAFHKLLRAYHECQLSSKKKNQLGFKKIIPLLFEIYLNTLWK